MHVHFFLEWNLPTLKCVRVLLFLFRKLQSNRMQLFKNLETCNVLTFVKTGNWSTLSMLCTVKVCTPVQVRVSACYNTWPSSLTTCHGARRPFIHNSFVHHVNLGKIFNKLSKHLLLIYVYLNMLTYTSCYFSASTHLCLSDLLYM